MKRQSQHDERVFVRRQHYGDAEVLAADVGDGAAVSVDVVDDTAIVVVERDGREIEREFDLPAGDPVVFNNNGVVTIEVRQ